MEGRFTALLVDDEPLALDMLKRLLKLDSRIQLIGEAADGETALRLATAKRPDVLFLDIGMPGKSGLLVASQLASADPAPLIVFVTAYDHHATEAFDLAVVDYVLKPVDAARLARAIERVATRLAAGAPSSPRAQDVWAPSRGGMVRIPTTAIQRIEAEGDYVRLHAGDRSYLLRRSISDLASRLDPTQFLQIHRSTLLRRTDVQALRHIGSGAWVAVDATGRTFRIGRQRLGDVRAALEISAPSGRRRMRRNP
jgi:two-component system, LytTR family, response regulator AlgR